jgi:lysozyme
MTPRFDILANQYLEEELSDKQKYKLLALAAGSAIAMPGTAYLGQKAGEALRDDDPPAPIVQKAELPKKPDMIIAPSIDSREPVNQKMNALQQTPTADPVAATFDSGFLDYMKRVENGIKKGLKAGKWYPHSSAEGGKKTIAYGHKLKTGEDFSKGLTGEQAIALLKQDLDVARTGAREFVGADKFDKLDAHRQEMLIDFQFNLGSLNAFPSFVAALLKNDKKEMKKHYERKYQHPTTKKWLPIKDRNNQFKKRYLPSK